MNPPSGEQPANFQLYGRFTTEARQSTAQESSDVSSEIPESTIDRVPGSIESPVGMENTDTVTETSTDVVSSTLISTIQSTEVTTISTTDSVAETGSSTVVVTSTAEETISTTITETSTVQITQMITATATAYSNPQNPTASLIITPYFYTQTETVQDTVTVTIPASNTIDQPESQPGNEVTTETVTVTETEAAENISGGDVTHTVTESADGISPIIFTQTVYSFIDAGESDIVQTVTETTTETATPEVITSYLTFTSVQFSTITETVENTATSSLDEEPVFESTESEPESSSSAADEEGDSKPPSGLITGLIVALVLFILLLIGLLYYLCIYRKRKQREQDIANGYFQKESSGRIYTPLAFNNRRNSTLSKRAVSASVVNGLPYGVLLNGDSQSVCAVVAANKVSAFVAASCLDFSGNSVAGSYKAVFNVPGSDKLAEVAVSRVKAHPNYNPNTFANNIAFIQFSETELPSALIGDWPIEWQNTVLVHASLNNDQSAWNEPILKEEGAVSENSKCSDASTLYSESPSDYMCSTATHSSLYDRDCVLPYKIAMGYDEQGAAPIGLYSHSATSDSDAFCGSGTITSYYILFKNYIPWFNQEVGTAAGRLNRKPDGYTVMTYVDYQITPPEDSKNSGQAILSLKKQGETVVGTDGLNESVEAKPKESGDPIEPQESQEPRDPNDNEDGDRETITETKTVTEYDEGGGGGDVKTTTTTETETETETEIVTVTEDGAAGQIATTQFTTDITTVSTVDVSVSTVSVTETTTETTTEVTTVSVTLTQIQTDTASLYSTTTQPLTYTWSTTMSSLMTETITYNATITESIEYTSELGSIEPEILTVTETVSETCPIYESPSPLVETITDYQTEEITLTTTVSGEAVVTTLTVSHNESVTNTLLMTATEYVPTTVIFTVTVSESAEESSESPSEEPEESSSSEDLGETDSNDPISGLPLPLPALIAIIVVIILLMIIIGWIYYRRRMKKQDNQFMPGPQTRYPSYNSQQSYRGYSGYSAYGDGGGYTGIAAKAANYSGYRNTGNGGNVNNSIYGGYAKTPRYTSGSYRSYQRSTRPSSRNTNTTAGSYWPTPARNTTWSMNTSQLSDFGEDRMNHYSKYDSYFGNQQTGYDSSPAQSRGWFGRTLEIMKLGTSLLTLAAGLSSVLAGSVGEVHYPTLFRRNGTEDLQSFKGAVLLKNGEQTSCEVALMYSTFGFVSAACLDYTDASAKTINTTTNYEVAISSGLTSTYGRFRASKVTPNPGYDPVSYANNIALVEFESNGSEFVNYIASWRQDWVEFYYTRRSLSNAASSTWNSPATTMYNAQPDLNACAQANTLFMYNQKDLICNELSTPSIMNASCSIPYASIYGVNDPNAAVAALYSHSAVENDGSLCGNEKVYNYFIVMQNYVHWAMSIMGKKAPVFHTRIPEYTEVLDPGYSMIIPKSSVEGVAVYAGDLYHLDSNPAEAAEEDGGLSPGAIAGIILGLLALLALLGFFIYKKLRERYESNRVRRWWFFGRFEKEEKPEEVGPPMADPNDPQRPSTYPVQF
ncbi:hypothetical protein LPJ68_002120 [Coemansia sp. RSA 1086]|nr:hypothetical protein LPJ68_002120 [Coemansia sp. RSA 1086]